MFVKLVIVACSMGVALAAWHGPLAGGSPADKYPAGVSPQACPNYPHCNNPAVAANPAGAGGWNGGWNGGHAGGGGGGWNGAGAGGGWNGAGAGGGWNGGWNGGDHGGNWNGNGLDSGEYTGDGDYRGEGLQESGAYGDVSQNYNSWDNGAGDGGWNGGAGAGGWNGGHAGAWNGGAAHAAAVPAGVDPHACPNYPFCH